MRKEDIFKSLKGAFKKEKNKNIIIVGLIIVCLVVICIGSGFGKNMNKGISRYDALQKKYEENLKVIDANKKKMDESKEFLELSDEKKDEMLKIVKNEMKREKEKVEKVELEKKKKEEEAAKREVVANAEESKENHHNIKTVKHGELLDVTVNEKILVIKTKIESSYSNNATIIQNGFNVEDIILNQEGDKFDEIQYWAVANMQGGDESKVVSFTLNKRQIEAVKNRTLLGDKIVEEAEEKWILPSLR